MQAITALLVVCLAAASYAVPTGRVVGGSDAPEGKYPYQVALKVSGRFNCGGSVISKRYVLTAAHCLSGYAVETITVHAGSVYLDKATDVYAAEKLIIHENYDSYLIVHDIGLVRVSKDIEYTEFVQPIPLVSHNNAKRGDGVVLTGWGSLGINKPDPNHLQQIDLRIESPEKCTAAHSIVKPTHICTFTKVGEGACVGDSGGPLVANGVQVGIVSFGAPCALGYPDVYTRVFSYLDWIQANQE